MAKASTVDSKKLDKPAKAQKAKTASSKPSIFARVAQYFRDVRSEMKRVVWPTRNEVWNSSVVVVVTLLFFVVFAFVIDSVVLQVLQLIAKIKVG